MEAIRLASLGPVEDFDLPVQEVINASVLSVESAYVRVRVISPVAHTHHFGNTAGHGFECELAAELQAGSSNGIPSQFQNALVQTMQEASAPFWRSIGSPASRRPCNRPQVSPTCE